MQTLCSFKLKSVKHEYLVDKMTIQAFYDQAKDCTYMFFCLLSEEHVSVLLDIRGDVSRDIRGAVLDLLEQSAPPLPAGYRPIFTDIMVPPSTLAFCLPTAKCA